MPTRAFLRGHKATSPCIPTQLHPQKEPAGLEAASAARSAGWRAGGCCGQGGDGLKGAHNAPWPRLQQTLLLRSGQGLLILGSPRRSRHWGSLFQQKLRLRCSLRLLKTIFLLQLFPDLADMLSWNERVCWEFFFSFTATSLTSL